MANKDFKKIAAQFRGKRFSDADKKAIFDRCRDLIKEGVDPGVAVTIMNAEGFRRVDGSPVTASWVKGQFDRVREAYKDKKVKKGSGPVKEVYRASHSPTTLAKKPDPARDSMDLVINLIVSSNLHPELKVDAIKLLLGN